MSKPTGRPPGRPTTRTPEMEDALLSRVEQGELLDDICVELGIGGVGTVRRWKRADAGFARRFADAQVLGAMAWAGRGWRILQQVPPSGKGSGQALHLAREQAGYCKWMASKLDPRRWGDRQQVDLTGETKQVGVLALALPAGSQELPPPELDPANELPPELARVMGEYLRDVEHLLGEGHGEPGEAGADSKA